MSSSHHIWSNIFVSLNQNCLQNNSERILNNNFTVETSLWPSTIWIHVEPGDQIVNELRILIQTLRRISYIILQKAVWHVVDHILSLSYKRRNSVLGYLNKSKDDREHEESLWLLYFRHFSIQLLYSVWINWVTHCRKPW